MNIHLILNIGPYMFLKIINGSNLKKMYEFAINWSNEHPEIICYCRFLMHPFFGIKLVIEIVRMVEVSVLCFCYDKESNFIFTGGLNI